MRFFLVSSLVLLGTSKPAPSKLQAMFEEFIIQYDRQYSSPSEKMQRFQIFSDNLEKIQRSNAMNKPYTLGITKNADQTFEEWRSQHLTGFRPRLTLRKGDHAVFTAPSSFVEPASVDWVAKGAVTRVKNQGTCGSCWTFSAVGALEGAMYVAGRPLTELSMQHILSCDHFGHGCRGGSMTQAFAWVGKKGVPSLKYEPYLCEDGSKCRTRRSTTMKCPVNSEMVLAVGDVVNYTVVSETENALEAAVAQQPVSVAIEADKYVFQHYKSGILTDEACGSDLDHGVLDVLAVGYGDEKGQKYWKVKNSWGTSFGEDGYIRIAKGAAPESGECGIRKIASFPTVKGQVLV